MQTLSSYIEKIKPVIKSQLSLSAWRSESSRLNIIQREIGYWQLKDVTKTEVVTWVNTPKPSKKKNAPPKPWSPKTRNAYLSLLRKVLKSAVEDNIIMRSPLRKVEFYKVGDAQAQPFTKKELLRISSHEMTCHQARLMFTLGIATGLRISELIAVAWEDIDFHKKLLHVRRAKPLADDIYKVPKTNAAMRTIELNDIAIATLRAAEFYTAPLSQQRIKVKQRDNHTIKKVGVKFVFYNSFTDKPFLDPKQYAKTFFTPMLKALDIQHRGPSQIRHTFASQAITMGLSKEWVRRQLGHVNDDMLNKHYAQWIEEDASNHSERYSNAMSDSLKTKSNSDSINDEPNPTLQPKVSFFQRLFKPFAKKHISGQRL